MDPIGPKLANLSVWVLRRDGIASNRRWHREVVPAGVAAHLAVPPVAASFLIVFVVYVVFLPCADAFSSSATSIKTQSIPYKE